MIKVKSEKNERVVNKNIVFLVLSKRSCLRFIIIVFTPSCKIIKLTTSTRERKGVIVKKLVNLCPCGKIINSKKTNPKQLQLFTCSLVLLTVRKI